MAAQQQPPQQPIYPDQLSFALDRQYTRYTDYVDARFDKVLTQMRVDKQESLARDNELRAGMQQLADAILILTQRVSALETTEQTIIATLESFRQEMREGFAAQAERHNELMVRVEKLERKGNLPEEEK